MVSNIRERQREIDDAIKNNIDIEISPEEQIQLLTEMFIYAKVKKRLETCH